MGEFWDDLKANPLLMAIGAIVILLAVLFFRSKMGGSGTSVMAAAAPAVDANGNPLITPVPVSYTNVYQSYPLQQIAAAPVPTANPVVPVPTGTTIPVVPVKTPGIPLPIKTPAPHLPIIVKPVPVVSPPHAPTPVPVVTHQTPVVATPAKRYVTVTADTATHNSPLGTMSGIAAANGISLTRLELLNPNVTNPNLVYPGQQIRVA